MTKNEIYKKYGPYQIKNPSIHHEAFFKTPNGTIHIYKSGKILIQGNLANETNGSISPVNIINQNCAGSDETGKGDIFGPLVCAAVEIIGEIPTKLSSQIGDSKYISDTKIEAIVPQLLKYINYSIFKIQPDKINELILKYNFNEIVTLAHVKAFENLNTSLEKVIDGYTDEKNFRKYLSNLDLDLSNYTLVPKAENKYLSVAIASILARYEFINCIDEISKKVGFIVHKGAGKAPLEQVLNISAVHRKKFVKLSFKNVKAIINKSS
jgi:ribonuclease HIII